LLLIVLYYILKGEIKFTLKDKWKFIFPPLIHVFSLTVQYVGLTQTAASVAQMMYGSAVLWSAIFSWILLKKTFSNMQLISIFTIIIGTIVVGLSTAYLSEHVFLY